MKEEDRLAAIIQIISEEAAVVPRGGLFKQTDGVTVHSRAFEGLSVEEADELCSFQHYRTPQHDWNTNLLTRVDYNYAMDFLDTIDTDIPQGLIINLPFSVNNLMFFFIFKFDNKQLILAVNT